MTCSTFYQPPPGRFWKCRANLSVEIGSAQCQVAAAVGMVEIPDKVKLAFACSGEAPTQTVAEAGPGVCSCKMGTPVLCVPAVHPPTAASAPRARHLLLLLVLRRAAGGRLQEGAPPPGLSIAQHERGTTAQAAGTFGRSAAHPHSMWG